LSDLWDEDNGDKFEQMGYKTSVCPLCGDRHFWHVNVTEKVLSEYMSDHFDKECDTVKATQVLAKTDIRPAEVSFVDV
jgi:hypothetical protein